MGRAIVREPAVFLFDEPLSNLDAKLRVQMRFEIQKLHRRLSTTSLYVTHDQVEAMTLAQRMIVMNAGRAEQIGTPMEVYENPETLFVAGFIGSPAMNILPGRAEADGRIALDRGGSRALARRASMPAVPLQSASGPSTSPRARRPTRSCPEGWRWSSNSAPTRWSTSRTAPNTSSRAYRKGCIPRSDSILPLAADPARVYIFDGATGARIR